MATIKRNFSAETTVMNPQALNDTTEFLSSNIDLETEGYEAAHVTVYIDFGATPEYNAVVKVYGSLDAGTTPDKTPIWSQEIDKGTDPNQISFPIKDLLHFKIGISQAGTVTNDAVATVKYQAWNHVSS
jgi:hypothetical protein